jgi:hypothetical protein
MHNQDRPLISLLYLAEIRSRKVPLRARRSARPGRERRHSQVDFKFPILHFVMARDGSRAGEQYNSKTLASIRQIISSRAGRARNRNLTADLKGALQRRLSGGGFSVSKQTQMDQQNPQQQQRVPVALRAGSAGSPEHSTMQYSAPTAASPPPPIATTNITTPISDKLQCVD